MLISIALVSCSNAEPRADDFAKKVDCSEKTESVKMELDSLKVDNTNLIGNYYLQEVFYSPSLNTCVVAYVYHEKLCGLNYGCTKPEDYDNQMIYVIQDVLTGRKIYDKRHNQVGDKEVEEFENKIAELQK